MINETAITVRNVLSGEPVVLHVRAKEYDYRDGPLRLATVFVGEGDYTWCVRRPVVSIGDEDGVMVWVEAARKLWQDEGISAFYLIEAMAALGFQVPGALSDKVNCEETPKASGGHWVAHVMKEWLVEELAEMSEAIKQNDFPSFEDALLDMFGIIVCALSLTEFATMSRAPFAEWHAKHQLVRGRLPLFDAKLVDQLLRSVDRPLAERWARQRLSKLQRQYVDLQEISRDAFTLVQRKRSE